MQTYQQILQSSTAELSRLNSEKAVLESKIKEQVEALGLDPEKPLIDQINAETQKLSQQFDAKQRELEETLTKLEQYKAEGDGTSDFE